MSKKYKKAIHLFRRDLRIQDNTALNNAVQASEQVLPLFVFDPRQLKAHPYRSVPGLLFMLESLRELSSEIAKKNKVGLTFLVGESDKVIKKLFEENSDLEGIFFNGDYTPFSKKRDKAIEKIASDQGRGFHCYHDTLLNKPGSVLTNDGGTYTVYTPYYKKARQNDVPEPYTVRPADFTTIPSESSPDDIEEKYVGKHDYDLFRKGGRKEALSILGSLDSYSEYDDKRNYPSIKGTTGLSPHHKFGTVSVREVHARVAESLGEEHGLISELHWRDFFSQIAHHSPHVYEGAFRKKYDAIDWPGDTKHFELWCEGKTGFPIVDAGMRELNKTGYMHNRVRMIVASFLTKDLHVHWKKGEKYFATQLLDYDPAVNNGNWQWAASTGCDAQPYFRIFNPWSQQQKFDKDAEYIKRWVPELEALNSKQIHKLGDDNNLRPAAYPAPIVEHKVMRERALSLFNEL